MRFRKRMKKAVEKEDGIRESCFVTFATEGGADDVCDTSDTSTFASPHVVFSTGGSMSVLSPARPDRSRACISPAVGLLTCVVALSAFGLVMLFSSSYFWALQRQGISDPFLLMRNQTLHLLSSFILLLLVSQMPIRWMRQMTWPVYLGTLLLLSLVFVPGIGVDYHGSNRWIVLGGIGMQPSECAKLSVIFAVSWFASGYSDHMDTFGAGFLPVTGLIAMPSVLVILEPDLGTGAFLIGLGFMVAIVAGLRLIHLIPSVLAAVPGLLGLFWYRFEHFRERIQVFLNPGSDPLGTGHQIRQSLIAIGSGGTYGVGPGLSEQKLFFLPQPNSDFIFSIIAEETGFAGCVLVIVLYVGVVWFGFQIARGARDRFGRYAAAGITLCISIQAILNIAVATALFPTKGLPLPFISKGGSSIMIMAVMVGILLAVHNGSTEPIRDDVSEDPSTRDQ